jgi:hypothetical protein
MRPVSEPLDASRRLRTACLSAAPRRRVLPLAPKSPGESASSAMNPLAGRRKPGAEIVAFCTKKASGKPTTFLFGKRERDILDRNISVDIS